MTEDSHLWRCYLIGRAGDAANVALSAIGHNFRHILAWRRNIWCQFLAALIAAISVKESLCRRPIPL